MKLVCTIVLLCTVHSLAAQSPAVQQRLPIWSYGGFAGYSLNLHGGGFRALPTVPCCSPGFDGGSGGSPIAGVLAGYPLSSSVSVQMRAGYAGLHGLQQRDELIGNTPVRRSTPPFDTTAVDVVSRHSIDATLHTVFLEPSVVWSPVQRLGLAAGLSGSVVLADEFRQKEELQSPSTVVYTGTDSRVRNEASGAIPGVSALLWHATAAVSYDLPVGTATVLAPELRLRVPLNSIADVDWQVMTLSFGAALRTDVFESAPVRIERDTLYRRDTTHRVVAGIAATQVRRVHVDEQVVEEQQSASLLRSTLVVREDYVRETPAEPPVVALDVAGRTRDGSRTETPVLLTEEVQTTESFPLVPYIFFEQNSAVATVGLRRIGAAQEFDTTRLAFSSLDVYAHTLDVLGARMQRFPGTSVVITGCIDESEQGTDGLAERRAAEVRHYLATVWQIAPERLHSRARGLPAHPSNTASDDGRGENRRVELFSDDERLLRPVVLHAVERTVTPPVVECVPTVHAAAVPVQWRLAVSHAADGRDDGPVLFDTAGTGTPPAILWRPAVLHTDDTLLVVRLSATDAQGLTATTERTLAVQHRTLARKRLTGEDVVVERYSLVLFDYNSAEIDADNQRRIRDIRERIRPGSRVRIEGYADRTGDAAYNKKLAERRCREVHRLLGHSAASIEAVGSAVPLFDNDLPQGRMYSRTVHIIIETPADQVPNRY